MFHFSLTTAFGPLGEALGPDTWTARSLQSSHAAGLPYSPQTLSAGGAGSQGLVCPPSLSAGKLSEISFVLKRKHKGSARQKWAQRQLAHRRHARETQETGYRVFKGSLTYPDSFMPPGYCGPTQSSRPQPSPPQTIS